RFLLFYLLCGFSAAIAHIHTNPESTVPVVGASGAVAGVLGAYMVMFPRSQIITLIPIVIIPWFVRIPAVFFLGIWFLMQLYTGEIEIHTRVAQTGGVAFMAHVGGFIAGIVFGLILARPPPPDGAVDE